MTFRFGAVTTLSLTALTLLACGGKTISIGSETSAQTVLPSSVNVATSQCSQGYEHANICCTGGGNGSEPTCESYTDDPFHPCDSGWTTYPNATTCCSLDNPADCTGSCAGDSNGNAGECQAPVGATTVEDDGGFADAGFGYACETRCPPGYTGISPYDPKGCCQYNANGEGECFGESSATTSVTDGGVPPILLPDGGVYDGGAAPDDAGFEDAAPPTVDAGTIGSGGSGGGDTVSTCSFECPDGWFVADAVQGVCCNNSSSGDEECFAAVFPGDDFGSTGTDGTGPSSGSSGGSGDGTTTTADASAGR